MAVLGTQYVDDLVAAAQGSGDLVGLHETINQLVREGLLTIDEHNNRPILRPTERLDAILAKPVKRHAREALGADAAARGLRLHGKPSPRAWLG